MQFLVREVNAADAKIITRLSNQLGYSLAEEDTRQNLEAIGKSPDEMVLAAIHEKEVIGWIHVFKTIRVESGTFCEIGGLVVSDEYRRKGIGKILVERVRQWCLHKGIPVLRVRCNVKRTEAHEFYTALGFKENKQQKVFETFSAPK